MTGTFAQFLRDESGVVTVDWVVVTSGMVALALSVSSLVAGAVEDQSNDIASVLEGDVVFRSRHFGRTALEVAQGVELTHFGSNWVNNRMAKLMDPEEVSDQQLRNQHSTWTSRAADPNHAKHDRAADQVAVLEIAMDARGVRP